MLRIYLHSLLYATLPHDAMTSAFFAYLAIVEDCPAALLSNVRYVVTAPSVLSHVRDEPNQRVPAMQRSKGESKDEKMPLPGVLRIEHPRKHIKRGEAPLWALRDEGDDRKEGGAILGRR